MHSFFRNDATLTHADLAALDEVFDALCKQERLARRSAAADEIARRIMQLYKFGVRERAILMTVVQSSARRLH